MKNRYIFIILAVLFVAMISGCTGNDKIKTLIITGQGKEQLEWMTRSAAVQQILDDAGLFSTKMITTPPEGEDMSGFKPVFSKYDLVVIDYEGDAWPASTVSAFRDFVESGGGVVRIQSKSEAGSPAPPSVSLSKSHDFEVRMRNSDHPVTKGLPVRWMHPQDVIVQGTPLSGEDLQVLATAFSDTSFSGSGRPEPVLLAKTTGKGRVFWTLLGTPDLDKNLSLHSTGFIVTLQRGAEWAATGVVTQEVPFDFPTAAGTVVRDNFGSVSPDEALRKLATYETGKSTLYFTWLQSQIRKASGNPATLLELEKKMTELIRNNAATIEAKKLIMKELSWMGTDYSLPAIKELSSVPELKDEVDFALERLQNTN